MNTTMNAQVPKTPKSGKHDGSPTASATTSPTGSENSLLDDPPDYIAPDTQDMMLTDITSSVLHSNQCTTKIGRGKPYLSLVDSSFPGEWPAAGVIYGYNKRLMINLPCRRARPDRGYKVLNVYFLVDTGSPCSYLCREAMEALIDKPSCNIPEQLEVVIQNEDCSIPCFMSPPGTPEEPGKFHYVNVLGMDFLVLAKLSMLVNASIHRFRLSADDNMSAYSGYPDEDEE